MNRLPDHTPDFPPEETLLALLRTLDHEAAPLDRTVLAKLRGTSTAAFTTARSSLLPYRRPAVLTQATRFAAVVAALLILGVLTLLPWGQSLPQAALVHALQRTGSAQTLHARLTRAGHTYDVWAKQGHLRIDAGQGRYQIVKGRQAWQVNERENRVTPSDVAIFGNAGERLDLLQLVGIPLASVDTVFLEAVQRTPVSQGVGEQLAYTARLKILDGIVRLHATVDAATEQLQQLEAHLDRAGQTRLLGQLVILQVDVPVADELFVVSDTLTEDGRVGKITDVQGCVALRPMAMGRWTPVGRHLPLKPGDWLRTDLRGANATAFQLMKNTKVILGPNSLVELDKPTSFRLLSGELEITVPEGDRVDITGPNSQKTTVQGKKVETTDKDGKKTSAPARRLFRAQGQLAELTKEPLWLQGFKGATTTETLGSLIATVDGRNVPLTVGYHKVTVEIRDQIARTTIEESFVNRTKQRLEGVFHFPLPQDASISGFGMWIGNELVEADIVEKQRAREIYEIIKSEKRDPGLLEWSGGNIFTARIFPIEPESEKRIKITYTQVLPLKGNRFTYSYALQSELLQQHPLRQLELKVLVNSVQPLKGINCPTHPTRNQQTAQAAAVEFTAQEYTPTRDFEVIVELEPQRQEVVLIPHRRGEDGYFMVQLTPPAPTGDWQRELLTNGEPLHLLVLADTSASIDKTQRENQAQVLAALFAALTPKDTVNLATCDVNCDWAFARPLTATPENLQAARQYLDKRVSLGWTDLDKSFAAAMKQAGPTTHVIYLGDGVVTTGDGDPTAFAQRLKRQYGGKGTFHAVALGSSYESAVLKAISTLGGGSLRKVSGEQTPNVVALDLLKEIAQPGLRNLKVEFRGLRTARVYPETLANLPAGTQQILLGRYLPEGKDQAGEVVVTAMQGNRPVRFSSPVHLHDAEQGNSFIPRLWARLHLDTLLELGSTPEVKEEIIALSEEFQIITPYTSLLVLETDADRERFKVKRQFRMRDGEKYFAEGRENATFALLQQQRKRAGEWRLGLQRRMLAELARMGRDPNLLQVPVPMETLLEQYVDMAHASLVQPGSMTIDSLREIEGGGMGGGGGFGGGGSIENLGVGRVSSPMQLQWGERNEGWYVATEAAPEVPAQLSLIGNNVTRDPLGMSHVHGLKDQALAMRGFYDLDSGVKEAESFDEHNAPSFGQQLDEKFAKRWLAREPSLEDPHSSIDMPAVLTSPGNHPMGKAEASDTGKFHSANNRFIQPGRPAYAPAPFLGLFPYLPRATPARKPHKAKWSLEATKLAASLLRTEALQRLGGGLNIDRKTEVYNPRWNELTATGRTVELVTSAQWLTRVEMDGRFTLVNWCDAQQRGVFAPALGTGRVRTAEPTDRATPPLDLADASLHSLEETYAGYSATIQPQGDKQALLILRHLESTEVEDRFLIDTEKHVLVQIEAIRQGKVAYRVRFSNFLQLGGSWWAGTRETFNDKGQLTTRVIQTVTELPAAAFAQRITQEQTGKEQVLFLTLPFLTVPVANQQVEAGKGTVDHHFRLMLFYSQAQQWEKVREHLQAVERVAVNKLALAHLQQELKLVRREHEQWRIAAMTAATQLADQPRAEELGLALHILQQGKRSLAASELLKLLDVLKPVFERQPAHRQALKTWQLERLNLLNTEDAKAADALRRELIATYPRDYLLQAQHAEMLAARDDYPAAYAHLEKLLQQQLWLPEEADTFRALHVQFLHNQHRMPDMINYLRAWILRQPSQDRPYSQFLQALLYTDQEQEYLATLEKWLKEAQVSGDLPPAARARLDAALAHLLGDMFHHQQHIDRRWRPLLAEAVLYHLPYADRLPVLFRIWQNWRFHQTEEFRLLQPKVEEWLVNHLATLKPAHAQQLVNLFTTGAKTAAWKQVIARIQTQWQGESKDHQRHQWGQLLVTLLSRFSSAEELLAFQRVQMTQGPEEYRRQYTSQYLETLASQPWKAEHEEEIFRLLSGTLSAEEPGERLREWVLALYTKNNSLLIRRAEAERQKIKNWDTMPRADREAKTKKVFETAQRGLADRLKAEEKRQPPEIIPWLVVERLYLEALLEENPRAVAAEAWTQLLSQPADLPRENEEITQERLLRRVLQQRHRLTLAWLATRKAAGPDLPAQVLKHTAELAQAHPQSRYPKQWLYQLLVALDRPQELLAALKQWAAAPDAPVEWTFALAYVQAELGDIPAAIALFEQLEQKDRLRAGDYLVLADWYLVANDKAKHDRARLRVYEVTPEQQMANMLYRYLQHIQPREGQMPNELNAEVPRMLVVLLRKSGNPQHYAQLLAQFYRTCRDFRILAALAEGMTGSTGEQVYFLLGQIRPILEEVRDEATVDQLLAQIKNVRGKARSTVDQRALDILEMHALRRASEVKNQPGQYQEGALRAMKQAFQRAWSDGEHRRMADLLGDLGVIPLPELAQEQQRQLKALLELQQPRTAARLLIAHRYAQTLWGYGKQAEAIDQLQAALADFQPSRDAGLLSEAQYVLPTLLGYLQHRKLHLQGERLLHAWLAQVREGQHQSWLKLQLYSLYHNALSVDVAVSLGQGEALFKAVVPLLQADLIARPTERWELLTQFCALCSAAHHRKIVSTAPTLQAFAGDPLTKLLQGQTDHYPNMVRIVADTLHDVDGPQAGLQFLIDRLETEPRWFRLTGQDGWNRQRDRLAEWRLEVKPLGDLEPRLLKIVMAELRRDLETQQQRDRTLYARGSHLYWSEKEEQFAQAAETVWNEEKGSGRGVEYIADYLYHGLQRHDRAISMLQKAHQAKLLDRNGQWKLIEFLTQQNRHAESITLLQGLIRQHPHEATYRAYLLRAYFHAKSPAELMALLRASDAHYRKEKQYQEGAFILLAKACLDCQLYEQAVAYYQELIPWRSRLRSGPDQTLAEHHQHLALAYAGLKKTPEAVSAAAGAVVIWGPRHGQRQQALETLKQVLRQSPDLDAFTTHWVNTAKQQDSAIIRKALGQVYHEKQAWAKALRQLQAAAELQPNDKEVHEALLACFDQTGDTAGAAAQLLQIVQLSRRDGKLYQMLGDRYARLGQTAETERAYTSIVEMLPKESEGHALLAEIRQQQNRWPDAIAHWQRVVTLRSLEPIGYLKLIEAYLHEKRWAEAERSLQQVKSKVWHSRFDDAMKEVKSLEKRLAEGQAGAR